MKSPFSYKLYNCAHCQCQFPFEKVRYTNDGKRLVCLDCYSRLVKSDEFLKREQQKKGKIDAPGPGILPDIKLICVDCRYKFSWKKGSRMGIACPYCGGSHLMNDDTTADKLIQEVSDVNELRLGRMKYKKYL
ncbi:hypothetical protein J4458_05655 [Candidatus Woesearchaeota archaeon]|nr:hypothetical protein [Candidatus Woesearchaeota archaeon]